MTKHQTVCLCMIVKNESAVIERSLESVSKLVDYYAITDTGSDDGTPEVIKAFLKKNKLKGEVFSEPWVDFAHNRNKAFANGEGKCDYIMTLDADEVIVPFIGGVPYLDKKVEKLPDLQGVDRADMKTLLGNCVYSRFQLFRDGLPWKWQYPVHEVCGCEEAKTAKLITGMCNIPRADGARSKDPKKYLRDAVRFETFLLDHPEDARAWFYLAQSYRDGGQSIKALKPLDEALKHSKWGEERYILHLRRGRYRIEAKVDAEGTIGALLTAYNERPHRAEALSTLLTVYRSRDMFHAGILIGEKLMTMKYAKDDILFVEKDILEWKTMDDLSVCYYWVGRFAEALEMTTKLRASKLVPPSMKPRIDKNHQFNLDRITEKKIKESGDQIVKVDPKLLSSSPREAKIETGLTSS